MEKVTLNDNECKFIDFAETYEDFINNIINVFGLDENLKYKMKIQTDDGTLINNSDDFEYNVIGEFPPILVCVDIPKKQTTIKETKKDDDDSTAPNKHFEIISENKTYSIDILIENEILILKASLKSLKNEQFENSYSFSQIQNIKYFRICENLNEAFLLLSELSNSKEKKIISKSNKEINIIFPINNVLINEVSFRLKLKEKNLEEKFNDLSSLVNKQQREIEYLKKKIEELTHIEKKNY